MMQDSMQKTVLEEELNAGRNLNTQR